MSRKAIPRSLPPAAQVFGHFPGFSESCNKQRIVLDELRKAAKRLKKTKSLPFYSMREVAGFFKVPLRTVAIAYEALENEGLFNRVRSSQTYLIGREESTQHIVRGIVGIPIWLLSMVISPYARVLHASLDEKLRAKGFVADFIFFYTGEDCEPDFAERLLRHDLNVIIWHTPHPGASQAVQILRDHGVRCITMQPMENPGIRQKPEYWMNWEPAYQAKARAWKEAGIRHAFVPKPIYLPSQRALQNFVRIIEAENIRVHLTEANTRVLLEKVRGQKSAGVAFIDQQGADTMCNEDPVALERILEICRVAFCRGPIRLPYFANRAGEADIVGFSPMEMADRLVDDLCAPAGQQRKVPYVFEAVYHPRQALNSIKDSI